MFGINGAGDGFFRIFFWCRWNVQLGTLSQVESHSLGSWGSFCPWVSSLPQHGVLAERTTDSPFRTWILSASGIFKEPGVFSFGFFDRIYFLHAFFAIFPAKHYNLIRLFWGFQKEGVEIFHRWNFFHVSVSRWVPHEIHQLSSRCQNGPPDFRVRDQGSLWRDSVIEGWENLEWKAWSKGIRSNGCKA